MDGSPSRVRWQRSTGRACPRWVGLNPWSRLLHTLRASGETALFEQFPISAVTEWMGHFAAVALKHDARVPDYLFERAAKDGAESGAVPVQKAVQSGADTSGWEMIEAAGTELGSRRLAFRVTLRGFEPRSTP